MKKTTIILLALALAATACYAWAKNVNVQVLNGVSTGAAAAIELGTAAEGAASSYGGTICTVTKTLTSGDFVVVAFIGTDNTGTLSVTDNADTPNTYTAGTKYGTGPVVQVFYSKITTSKTNATITGTATSDSGYINLYICNFTNIATSNQLDINTGGTDWSTSVTRSSGTLAQANEVVVCFWRANGDVTRDSTNGWTQISAGTARQGWFYKVVSSTTSVTYTGTTVGNETNSITMASFKGA
jgi:hypothetical protein